MRLPALASLATLFMSLLASTALAQETCETAVDLPCGVVNLSYTCEGFVDNYSLTNGGCSGRTSFGPDVVYRIVLQPGASLDLSITTWGPDAVLYLISDCPTRPASQCLVASDCQGFACGEHISYTNPADCPSTLYLVVDGAAEHDVPSGALTGTIGCGAPATECCDPLSTAPGIQGLPSPTPDGSSGAFVTWSDARRGPTDLYAHHVLSDGSADPAWPVNGVAVAQSGAVGPQTLVQDGAGGILALWLDTRAGASGIYAQRVDGNGQIHTGWPVDGIRVVLPGPAAPPSVFSACSDGVGGAYIGWVHFTPFSANAYSARIVRITKDGAIAAGWPAAGVAVGSSTFYSPSLRILAEPSGGVLFGFTGRTDFGPTVDVYTGRVGRILPTGAYAFSVSPNPSTFGTFRGPSNMSIGSDGQGGMFATWFDAQGGGTGTLYGQHHANDGATLWPVGTQVPFLGPIHPDGSGGAYLTNVNGVVHRRASDGTIPPEWPTAGFAFPAAVTNYIFRPRLDGLTAWWYEPVTGLGMDHRVSFLQPDGEIGPDWSTSGTPLCSALNDQTGIEVAFDLSNGALAFWQDQRNNAATKTDIYMMRVPFGATTDVPETPATLSFGVGRVAPNPARARMQVELVLGGTGPASLELIDLAGRRVSRQVLLGDGPRARTVDLDVARLPSGSYWLRLAQGGRNFTQRVAIIR